CQDKFKFLGAQRKWLELIAHTCRRFVRETDPTPPTTATQKQTISIENGETLNTETKHKSSTQVPASLTENLIIELKELIYDWILSKE
ncbi:hypothetical protein Bhyg_17777, partial [Pseudolycoriella hygida]